MYEQGLDCTQFGTGSPDELKAGCSRCGRATAGYAAGQVRLSGCRLRSGGCFGGNYQYMAGAGEIATAAVPCPGNHHPRADQPGMCHCDRKLLNKTPGNQQTYKRQPPVADPPWHCGGDKLYDSRVVRSWQPIVAPGNCSLAR